MNKEKTKKELLKEIKILRRRLLNFKRLESEKEKANQPAIETDRRRQEVAKKLKRDKEILLDDIIEKNADGILILDTNGDICFANSACESILGRKKEELLGVAFGFFLLPEAKEEFNVTCSSGEIRTVEARSVKILWEGKPASLVSVRDITERKEVEQLKCEITERKRINELKDEFISTVSHELRTPLAITKEGISIVLDGLAGQINPEQKRMLDTAKSNIDRLTKIINNLLDISKIEAGKVECKKVLIDLTHLIKDTTDKWRLESEKKHLDFRVTLPSQPINIYIDSDKIVQVLNNLINNAIKFTPPNGRINVELKDQKDLVEVSVSDTGLGIAKEDLPRVFGKFEQFARVPGPGEKGTGLGLSIVKELIEMHQGIIKVESEFGKGSCFSFTIPKMDSESVFKEYINNGIKEATKRKSSLSLVVIHIADFEELQTKIGALLAHKLLEDIEKAVCGSLRRRLDTVVRNTGELIVLLFDTKKEDVAVVKNRIQEAINSYLSSAKEEWLKKIQFNVGYSTYPDEANNHEELFNKAKTAIPVLKGKDVK